MTKLCLFIALLLALGACSKQTESASVNAAPKTTEAPDTDSNGPPPPADAVITTLPADPELEAAIRATDPNFTEGVADEGKTSYVAVRTDLNNDGQDEVFVYLIGPYFCGTGGCNLLLFTKGVDGHNLLASIPTSDALIIQAKTQTEGYSDFWRMQTGGGMPAQFVRHQFQTGKYVEASRTDGDTMPDGTVLLDESTAFANAHPLEPRKQ